ncbi:Rhs core protein with extension [Escherichia coli]|uniref:Rhs core protein with extension n=1 Tax=Escherichia coli TaxID=562 RepID=A0A376U3J1_ECOLX|nr:Rhs core protein with extension [Escherichia coli]
MFTTMMNTAGLTEKTDRIPTGVIRTDDERTHHYHYDSSTACVPTRIQHGEPLVESRYLYDPLGRMAKRGMAAGA